ncbi:hypothetical protein WT56_10800 [Burkholderia pseudomultivorans]|uniref:Uncharacterized protein n=2 Tax=Burkholderia pseudomultivorans TaxID=1207504 RepID=A0A132EJF6_9BURK|nr:hypothetical protein WT56_10800 [Burkholderia pseudomultivorans]
MPVTRPARPHAGSHRANPGFASDEGHPPMKSSRWSRGRLAALVAAASVMLSGCGIFGCGGAATNGAAAGGCSAGMRF